MKRSISLILILTIIFVSFVVSPTAIAETVENINTVGETSVSSDAVFLGAASATKSKSTFFVTESERNLLANSGFEEANLSYEKTDASQMSGTATSVSSLKAFEGEKSLKFQAGNKEEIAMLVFNTTPNTKYYFSFFINCSKYDNVNSTRLTFGIADENTGEFIKSDTSENSDNPEYYKTYQMAPPAYDEKWHMTGGSFSSGSETQLAFVIRGKNITAFIDNLSIFAIESDVVLGLNSPYWNLAKKWSINNGVLKFNSVKFSSDRHAGVISLKLKNDLKVGNTYTLDTDMSISSNDFFENFAVYYSPTLSVAASEEATMGKAPEGSTIIYKNYKSDSLFLPGLKKMPKNTFSFSPEIIFENGGYISLRFHADVPSISATATYFKLKNGNGEVVQTWDFSGFNEGTHLGTDDNFDEAQISVWFPNLVQYDTKSSMLKNNDAKEYKSPLDNLEHSVLVDETPTLLGTLQENNLVENYDFSDADTQYWSENNGKMYGDTLDIVDTRHNIQGKAFLYESNRKYPLNIYYIKWIDVEPNTEYTFSARFSLEKTGNSFIGILDGYRDDRVEITQNSVTPKLIGKINFDEGNYIAGNEWQSAGFTFNTMDRNRVGIAILDDGGKVYIDDLRLFETEKAMVLEEVEDEFPKKLTSTTEDIVVDAEYVKVFDMKMTLKEFRNCFDFGDYIRGFKENGVEITEEEFVGTGCVVKLINGNILKDSAVVIVKGDIDGDGLVNAIDLSLLRKHLIGMVTLSDVYVNAADLHTDNKVTLKDLVALKKYIAESDIELRAEIGHPQAAANGNYNIPFTIRNFNRIENGGAYYFKIKIPDCAEVTAVTLNGAALQNPNYEAGTGEYAVDVENNLILSNIFNDGSGDTIGKTATWNISVTLKENAENKKYDIKLSDDSFVIDLEENYIKFSVVNSYLEIK